MFEEDTTSEYNSSTSESSEYESFNVSRCVNQSPFTLDPYADSDVTNLYVSKIDKVIFLMVLVY